MKVKFFGCLLAAFGTSACSPTIHKAVENMQPDQRSSWVANQPTETLCNGYLKPWAQPETKLMIEAELASRGRTYCGSTKIGKASVSLLGSGTYSSSRTRSQKSYSTANDKNCANFSSNARAQKFFLATGGPTRDPHNLDADGDGLACEWGTDIQRIADGGAQKYSNVTGSRLSGTSRCYVGPRGGTYTITSSGNKNYSGC